MSHEHSEHSTVSCLATKRADAAAEVAAKEVAYEVLLKEREHKNKIQQLEQGSGTFFCLESHFLIFFISEEPQKEQLLLLNRVF